MLVINFRCCVACLPWSLCLHFPFLFPLPYSFLLPPPLVAKRDRPPCLACPRPTPVALSWSASAEGTVRQDQTWTGHEAVWQAQLWHQGIPPAASEYRCNILFLCRALITLLDVCHLDRWSLVAEICCYMLSRLKGWTDSLHYTSQLSSGLWLCFETLCRPLSFPACFNIETHLWDTWIMK